LKECLSSKQSTALALTKKLQSIKEINIKNLKNKRKKTFSGKQYGVMVSVADLINEVNQHLDRLTVRWVTISVILVLHYYLVFVFILLSLSGFGCKFYTFSFQ